MHVEETGDLIIRHVLASDEGKYQCVAHNMAATRESPAVSLSVYGRGKQNKGLYFSLKYLKKKKRPSVVINRTFLPFPLLHEFISISIWKKKSLCFVLFFDGREKKTFIQNADINKIFQQVFLFVPASATRSTGPHLNGGAKVEVE